MRERERFNGSPHPLTHSFTHPLTHSLTHPLTHSPTHPLTHSLTRKGDAGPVEAFPLDVGCVDAQHEHHRVGLRGRRQSQAEERIRLALDVLAA